MTDHALSYVEEADPLADVPLADLLQHRLDALLDRHHELSEAVHPLLLSALQAVDLLAEAAAGKHGSVPHYLAARMEQAAADLAGHMQEAQAAVPVRLGLPTVWRCTCGPQHCYCDAPVEIAS
jgi:hypothetical protein